MKTSLIISSGVHVAILAFATIAFPSAKPFEVQPMKTLPVDIVDASELTRLKAGKKEAKPELATPAPEKPVEVAKPAEQPKKEPPKKLAALPPEPEKAPEAPKVATPAPTPPKPRAEPAPKPEPKPEPKQAEPKPEEVSQALASNEPVPVPDLKPPRKPAPKKQAAPKPKERKFDADRIAALLNKVPDETASTQPSPDVVARADPGLGDPRGQDATMSINEIDALRQQIAQCWNPPIGVQGAADLAVRLAISLNPDGSVAAEPQLMSSGQGVAFMAAADSARRAVLRCQPYQLPPDKYDVWKDISVNFDPREMLGG